MSKKLWIKSVADWIVHNWRIALLIAGTVLAVLSIIVFKRSFISSNLSTLKKRIKESDLVEKIVMEEANACLAKRKQVYKSIDSVFGALLGN
jgi:hypothetical protein